MKISILTFEGFNEIDSLVAFRMLKWVQWLRQNDWDIKICCPDAEITSIGGLTIRAQEMLEEATKADAVIIGSGSMTRDIVKDKAIMSRICLDPNRQIIASQCSGALMLAKLGILDGVPACTDLTNKPWVQEAGVEVLHQPFFAKGNVATAGGCLASAYLAAWIITKLGDLDAATQALRYFAPVGEQDAFMERALKNISPYL